jgi:hypothetical protein
MKGLAILCVMAILPISQRVDAQPTTVPPATPQDIGAGPGHLPKVHYVPSRTMSYPLWIEESMLLNPDRSVNTDLVHPSVVAEIKALRRTPAEAGCVRVGAEPEDSIGVPPRGSIEEGTRNSRLVVLGKVTERAYGFKSYIPGQLLRVVPEETLKGVPRDVPAYFVFVPVGNFHLGDMPLCKTDDLFADPPQVGDEVVLFAPAGPDRHEGRSEPFLELEDDKGLVTVHSDDRVSLPRAWRKQEDAKSSPVTKDSLLERIRQAVAQERSDIGIQQELNTKGTDPCVTSLTANPLYGPTAWQLVPDSSVPSDIVAPAMAAWDSSSCNSGGISFPQFTTSPVPGSRPVPISYVQGKNPFNGSSCGRTSNNGITLYTIANKPGGGTVSCGNTNVLIQNLEHELGHQLDLADSNCAGYIMSQLAYPPQTGPIPPQPIPRNIHPSECAEANHDNITPAEQPPPTPPPTVCPPDCATYCTDAGTCAGGGGSGGDCEDDPWDPDCGPVLDLKPNSPPL